MACVDARMICLETTRRETDTAMCAQHLRDDKGHVPSHGWLTRCDKACIVNLGAWVSWEKYDVAACDLLLFLLL
jgi:hypothetical protein